jgi:hypothetical protein
MDEKNVDIEYNAQKLIDGTKKSIKTFMNRKADINIIERRIKSKLIDYVGKTFTKIPEIYDSQIIKEQVINKALHTIMENYDKKHEEKITEQVEKSKEE